MKAKKQYCKVSRKLLIVVFLIVFCSLSSFKVWAQGDLMISPKRVFFDSNNRSQIIDLINMGNDTAIYSLSFVENRVKETGDYELITEPDPGQKFASPFLRVYPRRIILAPREAQTIKVQLTNIAGLQEGEYRSHLYFRSERNNKPLIKETNVDDTTAMAVKIITTYGITIPCIIDRGISNTTVSISELEFENAGAGQYFLKMKFTRNGNMSSYGDLSVLYFDKKNRSTEVGRSNGFAVHSPGSIKKCKIALKTLQDTDFIGGRIKVIYTLKKSKKVLTEAELQL